MLHKRSPLIYNAHKFLNVIADLSETGGSVEMLTAFSGDNEGHFYSNSMYFESKKQI